MSNLIARSVIEVMRDEMAVRERILRYLQEKPRTVPEIAQHLNCPAYEATHWVMAMWRYGIIQETGKPNDEGYYTYRPAE